MEVSFDSYEQGQYEVHRKGSVYIVSTPVMTCLTSLVYQLSSSSLTLGVKPPFLFPFLWRYFHQDGSTSRYPLQLHTPLYLYKL